MPEKKGAPGLVEQLREAIRQSGKSLHQLSKESGVGSNQLSRFMRGERTLTLPVAEKICDVLHLHLAGDPSAADVREGPPPAADAAPRLERAAKPRKPAAEEPAKKGRKRKGG